MDAIIEKEMEIDRDKLKELVQKLKEKKEQKVVYEELYFYPLSAALLFLFIEFFITEKKKQKQAKEMV